jgi:hypothetical protein
VEAGANHDDSGAGSAADDASRDSAPADVSVADGDAAPPPGDAQATFIVFATSTPVGGDMMGVAMADAHCTTVAHAAGFPMSTTFVAWLSTAQKSAGARLVGDGPWHVPRADLSPGQLVAFDKVQLVGGVLSGPINRDEHGVIVARTVWTGTASNGGAFARKLQRLEPASGPWRGQHRHGRRLGADRCEVDDLYVPALHRHRIRLLLPSALVADHARRSVSIAEAGGRSSNWASEAGLGSTCSRASDRACVDDTRVRGYS